MKPCGICISTIIDQFAVLRQSTSSALTVLIFTSQVNAGLSIQLDYSYDSLGFFDDPVRRDALEAAADMMNRYVDDLPAIEPEGENTWQAFFVRPDGEHELLFGGDVPQDAVVVYVGGRPQTNGFSLSVDQSCTYLEWALKNSKTWFTTEASRVPQIRQQPTLALLLVRFPSIRIPNQVTWYFGLDADQIPEDSFDFITDRHAPIGTGVGSPHR